MNATGRSAGSAVMLSLSTRDLTPSPWTAVTTRLPPWPPRSSATPPPSEKSGMPSAGSWLRATQPATTGPRSRSSAAPRSRKVTLAPRCSGA